MSDSMTEWIAAYHDGELSADRRVWVEDHLAVCADCRRELADLQALSDLLHAVPVPASRTSNNAFTRQVLRKLPPAQIPFGSRVLGSGLRYAPVWVFGIWAFFQAAIIVSGVILFVLWQFPITDGAFTSLMPVVTTPVDMQIIAWFEFISLPFYTTVLEWLAWLSPLILIEAVVSVITAGIYLAWMVGMWSQRRAQEMG